jgi:hypothetical protein
MEPALLNRYLDRFNLQSNTIIGLGKAIGCLKGAIIHESDLGPYVEFNFACHVLKKRNPFSMMNMFFDFLHSPDPEVCSRWQSYGSPYTPQDVKVDFHNHGKCKVQLKTESGGKLSLEMNPSSQEMTTQSEKFNIQGYNSLLAQSYSFKIDMSAISCQRDFDPQVDRLAWSKDSQLGNLLEAIRFTPKRWSTHPDFQAKIFQPARR